MKKLSLPVRFGLLTSAMLIAYFLILALFHKHVHPAFSFFNAVITSLGIFAAIRLKKQQNLEAFSYGEGFKTGMVTGFIASIIFTFFFLVYATEINADFLPELLQTIDGDYKIDISMVTFVVLIMGFATTVISTLTVMQFFKRSKNISQNK